MSRSPLLLALLLLLGSCSTGRWREEAEVERNSRVLVQLEAWSGEATEQTQGFAHPAAVDALALAEILRGLRYRGSARSDVVGPVVAPEMVDTLAVALASGLRRAGPGQRVRFAVLNPDKVLFVPAFKLTRGTSFVSAGGELNLVFDQVDAGEAEFEFGEWGNPTYRSATSAVLVPVARTRLHETPSGQRRDDWLVASREAWTQAVGPGQEPAVAASDSALAEPPTPTAAGGTQAGGDPGGIDARAVKLRFLEELYREGLLAEKAYLEKRRQLEEGR